VHTVSDDAEGYLDRFRPLAKPIIYPHSNLLKVKRFHHSAEFCTEIYFLYNSLSLLITSEEINRHTPRRSVNAAARLCSRSSQSYGTCCPEE
jgi:hypothetical protein